jgi:hypothetical protein
MISRFKIIAISFLTAMLIFCKSEKQGPIPPENIEFGQPVKVNLIGYSGHIMEPCLSKDGNTLLFNNLNDPSENTNLHWATRINDSSFQYNGELSGVNTPYLEGVPALDNAGKLYFVSTRFYLDSLSAIFQADYANGIVSNIHLVNGISRLIPGWINFDVDISADGNTMYFVDGQIPQSIPVSADLVMARKTTNGFERLPNSNELLKNINTNALEYAACISIDQLELFFTRLQLPITPSSLTEIYVSKRINANEPFGLPSKIASITGFIEAATLSPDQKKLYYHKKENGRFVLYMVKRN